MALRWYVVHAFSQYEKKVAVALKERIERFAMQDRFGEIIVPTEEVIEMKGGQKRKSGRTTAPAVTFVLAAAIREERSARPRRPRGRVDFLHEPPELSWSSRPAAVVKKRAR